MINKIPSGESPGYDARRLRKCATPFCKNSHFFAFSLALTKSSPPQLSFRIRTRLATGVASREELLACLEHLLAAAGNAGLMTQELRHTLVDHAAGNYRIFISMAAELLMAAAQRDITVLDEKLYLQVFATPATQPPRRTTAGAR